MVVADVINGTERYAVVQSDCLEFLRSLPDDAVNLVCGSPPYEAARTYGIGFDKRGQDWVDWMVEIFRESQRVCTGPVVMVVEGQTRDYRWTATPALLMADLHRAGFNLRKPPIYKRIGIPGSGGPDWLRNDYEFCIVTTPPGKLAWSDNVACGHAPKWAVGGEMSHRLGDGRRRNQWGGATKSGGHRTKDGSTTAFVRKSHVMTSNRESRQRNDDTLYQGTDSHSPSGIETAAQAGVHEEAPREDGQVLRGESGHDGYPPPAIANPGNIIDCLVGGGVMGHALAHENEAPYPLKLTELFVKSFCPPDGIVCDVFSGSGTTAHAAFENGRRFIGCDVRESQVELTKRRLLTVTPSMFTESSA